MVAHQQLVWLRSLLCHPSIQALSKWYSLSDLLQHWSWTEYVIVLHYSWSLIWEEEGRELHDLAAQSQTLRHHCCVFHAIRILVCSDGYRLHNTAAVIPPCWQLNQIAKWRRVAGGSCFAQLLSNNDQALSIPLMCWDPPQGYELCSQYSWFIAMTFLYLCVIFRGWSWGQLERITEECVCWTHCKSGDWQWGCRPHPLVSYPGQNHFLGGQCWKTLQVQHQFFTSVFFFFSNIHFFVCF